ncbi:unnamed protein product [Dicrocoelium dendriticum]|nr:unnamed protein product [Dicrocoelium dendriticum]
MPQKFVAALRNYSVQAGESSRSRRKIYYTALMIRVKRITDRSPQLDLCSASVTTTSISQRAPRSIAILRIGHRSLRNPQRAINQRPKDSGFLKRIYHDQYKWSLIKCVALFAIGTFGFFVINEAVNAPSGEA